RAVLAILLKQEPLCQRSNGNHFGFFFLPAPKRNAKPFGFGFRKPIGPKSSKFSEWSKIIMFWG
ncbi:hypothetical protein, partial [Brucella inopinata]|uniref:hypothetical protein n=1 Tax=Brucella inopinata TaxID=1218315 RepID=UPI00274048A9